MLFLLDANAVSDVMDRSPKAGLRLDNLAAGDRAITCTIVEGEILFGIRRLPPSRRKIRLSGSAAVFFATVESLVVPAQTADVYARIKLESQLAGRSMNDNDLWIAATTIALDATLVTRDKDFQSIRGLRVEDWSV